MANRITVDSSLLGLVYLVKRSDAPSPRRVAWLSALISGSPEVRHYASWSLNLYWIGSRPHGSSLAELGEAQG